MPDLWMDVDTALSEVPVNILTLIDDTDFKTRELSVTYDQAGMDLVWNFVTTGGAFSQTAVTPTTGGDYDWTNQGDGMYTIEIPASGGASINNDTEGFGWFTGLATGIFPWRGPTIGFRAAALNNALINGGDNLDVNTVQWLGQAVTLSAGNKPDVNVDELKDSAQSATDLQDFADDGYDPATNKVQSVVLVDTTTTNSDMRGTDNAALASVATEARLAELDAGNLPTDIANLNDLSAADVNAEVDTALGDYDGPTYAELLNLVRLLARSDAALGTDLSALLSTLNADLGSGAGDYDNTVDAQEGIRDRGDAAWTTGGGGSITDLLNVTPLIPNEIDLANTATWRLGLMLTNALDDLPTTTEITPGTISIDRKAIGGTSWSSVVSDAAMSEIDGLVYYDEVFDSGTGYTEGDSLRVTFKSVKMTVAANDYEVVGATGRSFYTSVRQTERGTDSAALAINVPDTISLANINAEVDTALGDYDGPTNAEMEARTLVAASYFDPATDPVAVVTNVTNDVGVTQTGADKVWATASRTLTAFGFSVTVETNNDKTGYTLSAPGIQAIWDALTSALSTVGSVGKLLVDYVDAAVSSRSSHSANDVTGGTTVAAAESNIRAGSDTLATLSGQLDTAQTDLDNPDQYKADVSALALESTVQALNDISVSDILTTQMTESYAADGVAPTLAQALFLIQQSIGDFAVSGTTITVNKLDGATPAATYTTDDASEPTLRSRTG